MSHTPYYYAPGGKYVLFVDLLGFTAFVRSSFQKKAEEADDREKEFELAQKQFKIAQAEVDREYRRFHEHLEELLRRPARRGKSPAMSLVFSDCAYVLFERPKDAERFAVHAMRSFILNDMPVRMGLSYGSFTNYEFKTGVLPNGHLMFAAPFMGTAVVDSYRAESSGIKGMRILVHPSFFMSAPDLDDFLVPLPKSEQRPEAVGELNWYDLDLRLTLRRHIRRLKKSAPAEAQIHYDKTLCFIRRMEEFRSWYSCCCRMERVANVVYPERKNNMRYWRNLKRTKRYKEHTAAMKERARAEAEANPDGPFRDVLVQFPKNAKEPPIVTYGEPRVSVKASTSVDASA
jgi:hypothetical protein